MDIIGQIIRRNRLKHGYSIRGFAKKIKTSGTYLYLIEKDSKTLPSLKTITKLSKSLDIPLPVVKRGFFIRGVTNKEIELLIKYNINRREVV